MNVVPQYKVIGPYNYDRIIHNKNFFKCAKRQDIGQTSGKMHLLLIKLYCEGNVELVHDRVMSTTLEHENNKNEIKRARRGE